MDDSDDPRLGKVALHFKQSLIYNTIARVYLKVGLRPKLGGGVEPESNQLSV